MRFPLAYLQRPPARAQCVPAVRRLCPSRREPLALWFRRYEAADVACGQESRGHITNYAWNRDGQVPDTQGAIYGCLGKACVGTRIAPVTVAYMSRAGLEPR